MKADDTAETSLLDRRSYLKLAGTAAAAVAAGTGGAAAAGSTGYGAGGYGQVPYGGGSSGGSTGGSSGSAPTIERFSVSKSEQLGDNRMFSVRWAAADSDGDLDVVEVVVHEGVADVNFSVTDVSGGKASGWDLFQFPVGSDLDVTLHVKDSGNRVAKQSQTLSL